MRNLKRALSLTLASVMLLGMMIVGSSALSFNDADDITNVTAASVLEDLGIMQGDGSGNFMPDKAVTRAQMAIIVCRILYGNKLNVSQFEGTTQYTDVGANDYYTGYINLATQLGIIGGYGDGRFGPNDTVTTAQAALMLSRALGYFKGNEIAQASDWALASIAQATKIKMFGSLNLPTNAELARDNVAEMVFNTITATVPVQYNELLGVYYNENQGIIYALNFNYLETLGYKNFDLVYRDDTQDIYGRPARTWGTGTYNTTTSQGTGGTQKDQNLDANGGLIASRVRMLDKNEIITVALTPDYVYTDKKDQDEVWKDLGRTLCDEKDYTWTVYNNGEQLYSDKKTVSGAYYTYGSVNYVPANTDSRYWPTGKGAQTEIYVDDGDATVTVVEVNYYLGEVTRVSNDTVTVKSLSTEPRRLDVRTFTGSGWEVEDLVVFTVDENDDDDFYICEVFEPDVTTGNVKRVDKDEKTGDSYIRFETDGTKYFYSEDGHTVYDLDDVNSKDHPTLDEEYNLYRDPNGYVLAYDLAGEDQLNYLYVKDSDEEMKDWVAKVIYTDATTAKVDVKKDLKSIPAEGYTNFDGVDVGADYDEVHWVNVGGYDKDEVTSIDGMVWKYTKNDSGTHTLTWVNSGYLQDEDTFGGDDGEVDIYKDRAYIGTGKGRVIVDQKTVFVDIENEKVYTGYENVPNVYAAKIAYVLDRKGVADVVFIIDGDIYDDGYYFMVSKQDRETFNRSGNEKYWDYEKAFVDGEAQKHFYVEYGALKAADVDKNGILIPGALYKATKLEEDGGETYITRAERVVLKNLTVESVRKNGFAFSLTSADNQKELQYTTDKDTKFVLVEYNYKKDGTFDSYTITPGDINDLDVFDKTEEFNTYVTVVQEDKSAVQADLVYIIRCHTITEQHTITWTDENGKEQSMVVGEGKTFKQTIKAPEGEKFTDSSIDKTKLPADAKVTISADGSEVTVEFPVTDETAKTVDLDKAIKTDKAQETETWTLTLTGTNLTGKTDGAYDTTVWTADGKTQIPLDSDPTTIDGTSLIYKIPKGDTVLVSNGTVFDTTGKFTVTGGEANVTTAGRASVKMTANVTMDDSMFAAGEQTYTIKLENGIELTKLEASGDEVDLADVEHNADNSEWYVKADQNIDTLYVKTTDTEYAFASETEKSYVGEGLWNTTGGAANGGTARQIYTGALTDNITIYGATKVSVDDDIAAATLGLGGAYDGNHADDSSVNNDPAIDDEGGTYYVRPGTTLNVNMKVQNAGKPGGLIAREAGAAVTLTVDEIASTVEVNKKSIEIISAFQIEKYYLDKVVAVKDSTKQEVKDWGWVASDAEISVAKNDILGYAGVLVGGQLATEFAARVVDTAGTDATNWHASDGTNITVDQNLQLVGVVSIQNSASDSAVDEIRYLRNNGDWSTLVASGWDQSETFITAGMTIRLVSTQGAAENGFDIDLVYGGVKPAKTNVSLDDGTSGTTTDFVELQVSIDVSKTA